jgi:hypothetical protein
MRIIAVCVSCDASFPGSADLVEISSSGIIRETDEHTRRNREYGAIDVS